MRLFAVALLLIVALFAGCGGNPQPQEDAVIVRTDPLGLVTVTIEDGEATVSFHPEVWEEYADETLVYETAEAYMPSEGPFPVYTNYGVVKDAVVGQVPAMNINHMSDFVLPSVFLLMENGTVEWAVPNPFELYPEWGEVETIATLRHLNDIVALSYESDKEGIGEMTVYAEDASGLHYDVRVAQKLNGLYSGLYRHTYENNGSTYTLDLMFGKNGNMKLHNHLRDSTDWEVMYAGTYTLHLDEEASKGMRPGMLSVDLSLASLQDLLMVADSPESIRGDFALDVPFSQGMDVYAMGGDPLLEINGQAQDFLSFWHEADAGTIVLGDDVYMSTDFMTDDELALYVVDRVESAWEMAGRGMSTLVTGEVSLIRFDGECRDVWLGTDHDEQFVREILYTVGPWGSIYEYDPEDDYWEQVHDETEWYDW
jgi:hypothetical protein